MNNPITKCELLHTPASVQELKEYVERISGQEWAIAYTVMNMTWNLASKVIDDQNEAEMDANAAYHGQ